MSHDLVHLRHAARLAWRGHGAVEPNPMVGCVILDRDGRVVGAGHHRRVGGPHAEIDALLHAGAAARGGTAYVTLEPCSHHGRTGPCTDALIDAGLRRVVITRRDPNPESGGGAERLRAAGIEVEITGTGDEALAVGRPFVRRVTSGRPFVVAKWAQTLDGRIATRCGESQWISGSASRRQVHRQRARVDAIVTGIGTVIGDDPMLTARDVHRRRIARRVVVDPRLEIPLESRLVQTALYLPTVVACSAAAAAADPARVERLGECGVEVMQVPVDPERTELDCAALLGELTRRHDVTTALVEAGPGLTGRLLRDRLVDLVWVFIAPKIMADELALPCARGVETSTLADAITTRPIRMRRRGDDVEIVASIDARPDGA